MNWDIIEGNWKKFKGKFLEKWGDLTMDDWDKIAGKRHRLIGKLQEKFGWSREKAEREADDFTRDLH